MSVLDRVTAELDAFDATHGVEPEALEMDFATFREVVAELRAREIWLDDWLEVVCHEDRTTFIATLFGVRVRRVQSETPLLRAAGAPR